MLRKLPCLIILLAMSGYSFAEEPLSTSDSAKQSSSQEATLRQLLDLYRNESDPHLQEHWAASILVLDPLNSEASSFLKKGRGWTDESLHELISDSEQDE